MRGSGVCAALEVVQDVDPLVLRPVRATAIHRDQGALSLPIGAVIALRTMEEVNATDEAPLLTIRAANGLRGMSAM